MAGTLKAWDAINGTQGVCYAVADGNKEEMIYVKDIEVKAEKDKSEIKVLGYLGTKAKANGWKGTGSMTMYYAATYFRRMMYDYIKTGKDVYFELVIQNEDPSSEIGRQTVSIKNVNIDNVIMAKLDINAAELEEELDFTFEDVEILNDFDKVIGE